MRLRVAIAGAALVMVSDAVAPSLALANGRFPDAQQLVVEPGVEAHLAVQTTYGFVETRDGGGAWYWTCEDAAFYGGVLDPPIALLDGGTLIAGVFDGLVVATPDGCDLSLVPGELAGRFFVDVSTERSAPTSAIAVSSDGLGMGQFDTRVWKTTDRALTWAALGVALPADFLALTLDSAPSDPDRLYLTGFKIAGNVYEGNVARSTDAGATWELVPITGSANDSGPYLAAVDPNDPDTLYIRLAGNTGRLLVSTDAGATTSEIFAATGPLAGFALSPDGGRVFVGSDTDGVLSASTSDHAFTKVNDVGARCLTATDTALYVCAREAKAGYTIGKSLDGGATFTAIHHAQCLRGPDPACGADSSIATVCPGPWAAQKQLLQVETCEEGQGGAGGAGAGGGGAGGGGDDGGCGCRSAGAEAGGTRALLVLALVGLVALVRRRR